MRILLPIVIITLLINSGIFAETADTNTIRNIPSKLADTTLVTNTSAKLSKEPMGAVWRSLVMPGWGQWYVESYWKAPIFFAGAAGLYTAIFWNNSQYQKEADYLTTLPTTHKDYSVTKLRREYFRDNRDQSAFYLLVVYIFAAVDAYTGAHLFDFTVDDDLSFGYQYDINGRFLVGLRVKF